MPAAYTHPFSGAAGSTCSVATKYVADNANKLKGATASLNSVTRTEAWDHLKQLTQSGQLPQFTDLGEFSFVKKAGGTKLRPQIVGADEVALITKAGNTVFSYSFKEFEEKIIAKDFGSLTWDSALPGIVQQAPLTEAGFEGMVQGGGWDVVQAKIKAGTMQKNVDFLRISSPNGNIVKQVKWNGGDDFTVTFVKHPIANGNTFDAKLGDVDELIKNALEHTDAQIRWLGTKQPKSVIDTATTKTGALTDEDAATMFVKTKDELANQWGVSIKGSNPKLDKAVFDAIAKQTGYTSVQLEAKVERYKQSGKKLSSLKKKVLKDKPKPATPAPPAAEASQATVEKVVQDIVDHTDEVQLAQSYTDEEVAKAYVRAKDKVVADSNGKWTLYSKSDELDNAVYAAIRDQLPNIPNVNIKTQVSRYINEVKKLSQLKKQMVKEGTLDAKAPTLKGPKTLAQKAAEKDGEKVAEVVPPKVEIFEFTSTDQTYVYNLTQQANVALSNTPEAIYQKLLDISNQLEKNKGSFPGMAGYKSGDVLSVARVLDAKKAASIGKENAHLFENKLTEWVESGAGKDFILKQKEIAKLAEKAAAELPADSERFKIISHDQASAGPYDARRIQNADARAAARTYTGSDYMSINTALRNGMSNAVANRMDAGFITFKDDLLLHRGTSPKNFGVHSVDEIFSLIGKTVQDKGFLSTSVGGTPAFGGSVMMEIEAPKGVARGLYVDNISKNRGEREMLLARGTHFKILRAERRGGRLVVRVRIVG